MSQDSLASPFVRSRGSSSARVRQQRAPLVLAPPPPVDEVQPPVDDVTGLPLILCPMCKDVRMIALTAVNSKDYLGQRFFKCPRNKQFVPGTCPIYMLHEVYVKHLQKQGFLGSTSFLDAVPDLVDKINQLEMGMEEMKELVARNREPRVNFLCFVLGCINLACLILGILLVVMK